MVLVRCVGGMLNLVPNGLVSATHEGILECVVPIDLIECAWLVCTHWGIASWCIWSWRILDWPVCRRIVGRFWLLTTSLRLNVALVLGSVIPSLPFFIIGGWLVWTVLLCKHLSQWSGWSKGGGLNHLHWWCIVYLGGWKCHKRGNFPLYYCVGQAKA